jgi:plastocyanin
LKDSIITYESDKKIARNRKVITISFIIPVLYSLSIGFSYNFNSQAMAEEDNNIQLNEEQPEQKIFTLGSIEPSISKSTILTNISYIENTAKESLDTHTKNKDTFPTVNNNNNSNNTNSSSLITSPNPVATIVKGAPLLREFAFQPNPLIIQKGSTVTWNNQDVVTHTVTSGYGFSDPQMGKQFDSGLIGKTYKHIFKKPGEYPYFCQVHPMMQGKVIVK